MCSTGHSQLCSLNRGYRLRPAEPPLRGSAIHLLGGGGAPRERAPEATPAAGSGERTAVGSARSSHTRAHALVRTPGKSRDVLACCSRCGWLWLLLWLPELLLLRRRRCCWWRCWPLADVDIVLLFLTVMAETATARAGTPL